MAASELLAAQDHFALRQAARLLSSSDLGSLLLVCRSFNELLTADTELWQQQICCAFPNLRVLPERRCPAGRNAYIWRLRLQRVVEMPVRAIAWPAGLRPSPADLLKRWQPRAITFLVDVKHQESGTRLLSASHRCVLQDGRLTEADTRAERYFLRDRDCSVDSPFFQGTREYYFPLNVGMETQCTADSEVAAASDAVGKLQSSGREMMDPVKGLHVMLSYSIEGDRVPDQAPVVLLSEFQSFFNHSRERSDDTWEADYRTDVEGCWHGAQWFGFKTVHGTDEELERSIQVVLAHTRRYGCSPLEFDPMVGLHFSPPDKARTSTAPISIAVDNGVLEYPSVPLIRSDKQGVWSIRAEVTFVAGEDELDFSETVLPALLTTYHDASR